MPTVARDRVRFDERGLVTAIVQQHDTGQILMVAWMDAQALDLTLETGEAWFWSRSRDELWHKGETSGNVLEVVEVLIDCDGDTLVVKADVGDGVACHTGSRSCFHASVAAPGAG